MIPLAYGANGTLLEVTHFAIDYISYPSELSTKRQGSMMGHWEIRKNKKTTVNKALHGSRRIRGGGGLIRGGTPPTL